MAGDLSRLFAALADPTRRDIVARLTVGDATVGELAGPYEMSLRAISKHLKVLEDAGLVTRTRLHATSLCDSFEAREGWLHRGMEVGVNDGYAKLDELLLDDS